MKKLFIALALISLLWGGVSHADVWLNGSYDSSGNICSCPINLATCTTGTLPAANVGDLSATYIATTQKAAASGVCSLDASSMMIQKAKLLYLGSGLGMTYSVPLVTTSTGALSPSALVEAAGSQIGVATLTPTNTFQVGTTVNSGYKYIVSDGTTDVCLDTSGALGIAGTLTNHPFSLLTNKVERMRIDISGNVGIGMSTFGTSAVTVLGIASGTAPSTSPADSAQLWVADVGAVATKAGFHMRNEAGESGPVGFAVPKERTFATGLTLGIDDVKGTRLTNYGQGGNVILVLPAAAADYQFCARLGTTAAFYFRLTAGGSDVIYLDGVASTGAGAHIDVVSAVASNKVCCSTFVTGASVWSWGCDTVSGPWALTNGT